MLTDAIYQFKGMDVKPGAKTVLTKPQNAEKPRALKGMMSQRPNVRPTVMGGGY